MTFINNVRNIASSLIIAGSLAGYATAQEKADPVHVRADVSFDEDGYQAAQAIAKYKSHRVFASGTKETALFGANVETSDFQLNSGFEYRPEGDNTKLTGRLKFSGGFAGAEYEFQELRDEQHSMRLIAGAALAGMSLEGALDSQKNARAVAFVPFADAIASVGGGGNFDGQWEANLSYSMPLSLGNFIIYGRVGQASAKADMTKEVRFEFGRKLPAKSSPIFFSVFDSGINDTSYFGDATLAFDLGEFPLTSAERWVGDNTGDVGLDLRYKHDVFAYTRGAVNVGDYGFLNDVIMTAKWEYETLDKVHTGIGGLRTDISDTGFQVWGEVQKTEGKDLDSRVMLSWGKEF